MDQPTIQRFESWIDSIEVPKFSADLRSLLLEHAASNSDTITDVNTLYIDLIGFFEILDCVQKKSD